METANGLFTRVPPLVDGAVRNGIGSGGIRVSVVIGIGSGGIGSVITIVALLEANDNDSVVERSATAISLLDNTA